MSRCTRRSLLAITAALATVAHAAQTNPVVSLEAENATLCAKRAKVVAGRQDASGAACVRLRTPGRGRDDKPAEAA